MKQLGFFIDASSCTGCKACAAACKDKNNLPVGRNFRKVEEFAGGTWKKDAKGAWTQNVFAYYVSSSCNHCADPACVKVCPTKAHFKRSSDGLVLIDAAKCIGCGMCAQACPYGAPQLNTAKHKMTKCDACADRLEKGLKPSCVEACPQRALDFGDIEELRKRHGKLCDLAPLPAPVTKPSICIKAPRNAKKSADKSGTKYLNV